VVHDDDGLSGDESGEIEAQALVARFDALAGNEAGGGGGAAALDGADTLAAQEEADIASAGTVRQSPESEKKDDRPRRPGGTPRSIQKYGLSAGAARA
jgi:hypothetical protein